MRCLPCLFLLLLVGCNSRPQENEAGANATPDYQQALKHLRAQADAVGRSVLQEDHATMSDLTHPALVEIFGGRARYTKHLESVAAKLQSQGYRIKKFTVGEPSTPVQSAVQMYAVVPYEIELNGPEDVIDRLPGYLLAISEDRGDHWKFVDGAGAGRERIYKKLFPDYPEQLQLPAEQPFVREKK